MYNLFLNVKITISHLNYHFNMWTGYCLVFHTWANISTSIVSHVIYIHSYLIDFFTCWLEFPHKFLDTNSTFLSRFPLRSRPFSASCQSDSHWSSGRPEGCWRLQHHHCCECFSSSDCTCLCRITARHITHRLLQFINAVKQLSQVVDLE